MVIFSYKFLLTYIYIILLIVSFSYYSAFAIATGSIFLSSKKLKHISYVHIFFWLLSIKIFKPYTEYNYIIWGHFFIFFGILGLTSEFDILLNEKELIKLIISLVLIPIINIFLYLKIYYNKT